MGFDFKPISDNEIVKQLSDVTDGVNSNTSQLSQIAIKKDETTDGLIIQDKSKKIGFHLGSKQIWKTMPYNRKYGFGGHPYGNGELPPVSRVSGVFEADMLSVAGGKGRWNGDDTGNFDHGGHVFEGWNKEEDARITMGIGLKSKDTAWIQTFHPATVEGGDGGAYYGITKVGSDLDAEGCNFMPKVTQLNSALVLWNRPTEYAPEIPQSELDLLIANGEVAASVVNDTDNLIRGTMYYDTTLNKVRVYTHEGWKTLAFEA